MYLRQVREKGLAVFCMSEHLRSEESSICIYARFTKDFFQEPCARCFHRGSVEMDVC